MGFWLGLACCWAIAAPGSYERHVPPVEMTPTEVPLFLGLRHWVSQHQGSLRWDNRLAQVARALLHDPHVAVRQAAWQLGWSDGELAVVPVQAPAASALRSLQQSLQQQLALPPAPSKHAVPSVDRNRAGSAARTVDGALPPAPPKHAVPWVDMNRVGLAAHTVDGVLHGVAVLSRRLVHLAPVPARLDPNMEFVLVGRLTKAAAAARDVTLAFAYPDGSAHVAHAALQQGTFEQRVHVGLHAGVLQVQVLIDRGYGPEVASELPVGIGQAPWDVATEAAPVAHGGQDAAQTLQDLLWGARAARGLGRPQPDGPLHRAAQAHADEMARLHYFAHVSPTQGDAVARLARQGVQVQRLLEDLAAAPNADAAFAQWMASPAHRANVLDANVTQLGLGTAPGPGNLLAVLLLAQPSDSGTDAELTERTLRRLNQARREQGWPSLHEDLRLSALAQQRSRTNARSGALADNAPDVQSALAKLPLRQAAADSYRSESVDAVVQSAHVAEPFERVGVGVSRASTGQLWITVIYGG